MLRESDGGPSGSPGFSLKHRLASACFDSGEKSTKEACQDGALGSQVAATSARWVYLCKAREHRAKCLGCFHLLHTQIYCRSSPDIGTTERNAQPLGWSYDAADGESAEGKQITFKQLGGELAAQITRFDCLAYVFKQHTAIIQLGSASMHAGRESVTILRIRTSPMVQSAAG